jgi:hypothetical protein
VARTRIYAKNVVFFVDGKEQQCDVTSLVLQKDSPPDNAAVDGTQTFCDLNSGSVDNVWVCNITAIQSGDVTDLSLYSAVWKLAENGGGDVAFIVKPYGNNTATLDEPHYTGTFTVAAGQFPQVGGEASESAWTWSDSYLVKDDVVTRDPVITRAAAPAKS